MRTFLLSFLCVSLLCSPVYAFTDTYDISTPEGSESPTLGDDRIREAKRATQERLNVDHVFDLSGDTVDASTTGYHRSVHMVDQASNPANVAGHGIAFSKQVSSHSELHWRDDDGTVTQITNNGALNSGVALPSGAIFFMISGSCPSGTTDVSATYADKFLRVSATAGTLAGSDTHTHAAGSYAGPSHTHSVSINTLTSGGSGDPKFSGGSTAHAHTATTDAGGTGTVTGTSASGSTLPAYVTAKLCQVT